MDCTICFYCYSHLYIRGVPLAVSPGAGNGWKSAVRVVEFVVIGTKEECGERLLQRKQIKHHKDQRAPPKFKVIITFSTPLICISIVTIIINIMRISVLFLNWITMQFINIHVDSLNYMNYFCIIRFCSRLRDLCRDQSFIVSKPGGELISVLPEYSKP